MFDSWSCLLSAKSTCIALPLITSVQVSWSRTRSRDFTVKTYLSWQYMAICASPETPACKCIWETACRHRMAATWTHPVFLWNQLHPTAQSPVGGHFQLSLTAWYSLILYWYSGTQWDMGLSENSVSLHPMVLLIIIPMKNGYFIGNINPTFSGPNPYLTVSHQNRSALQHLLHLLHLPQWYPVPQMHLRCLLDCAIVNKAKAAALTTLVCRNNPK